MGTGAQFRCHLLTHLGVEVDHDDLSAGSQEPFRGGPAEPGGSAGDECDCAVEIHEYPSHD